MSVESTKRIARNTLLLYGRMLVMMLVTLYTSRKVLEILGPSDNNIYAVVGSFVALFWFLNTAMASATQRFLNVELEKGGPESVNRVFSMSVNIHIGIALIVLVIGEILGPWAVNQWLTIPPDRVAAAHWVYQFSLLTSCFNIVRVPYNAMIVANEKMSMYAMLTVAEAVLRLAVVLLLLILAGDKLILFSALTCGVVFSMTLIFRWYCRRKFDTCHYRFTRERTLMKQMVSFSGWSLLGSGANAASQHGINLLFNIVARGDMLNLAIEKATQVSNAVYSFVLNFQTAFNPQIMKSYAADDTGYFRYLIFRSSKYSYFLLLVIAIPVILCAPTLIGLWLPPDKTPAITATFVQLLMGFLLIDAISGPLWTAVQATGKIRGYQILMSSLIFLSLPLAYLVLRLGFPPQSALAVRIGVNFITYAARIVYLRRHLAFPAGHYVREVMLVALAVTALSFPVPLLVSRSMDGFWGLVVVTAVSCLWTGGIIFTVGMKRSERGFVLDWLRNRLKRKTER